MEERIRIQSQLQQLREESIREYLEGKLESIASKEVVNDILLGLLTATNQEFLASIAENILEVKNSNRKLKETIQEMRAERESYARSKVQQAREESKQQHLSEIAHLREELSLIKHNIETENEANKRDAGSLVHQVRTLSEDNQRLQDTIIEKDQNIEELTKKGEECERKLAQHHEVISALHQKELEMKEEEKRYVQSLTSQNQMKMMEVQKHHSQEIKQFARERQVMLQSHSQEVAYYQASLKEITQRKNENEEQLKEEINQCSHLREVIMHKQQEIRTISSLLARNEQAVLKGMLELEAAAKQHFTQQEHSHQLANQLRQTKQRLEQTVASLQKEIKELREDIKNRHIKEVLLEQSIKQKELLFAQGISKQEDNIKALKESIMEKERNNENLQILINEQGRKCSLYQQQIASLLKYNAIQQQEIARYQSEIAQIRQECKEEITTYQQTFSLNVSSLEHELQKANQKIGKQRADIHMLREEVEGEREKEKYYALYLEEIAVLKRELSKQQFSHSISKKQKYSFLLTALAENVEILSVQNNKLKQSVRAQIKEMQASWQENVMQLISEVQLVSAKCLYCQHEKRLVLPHRDGNMDKTVARGQEMQSTGSIKRNLRSIQQKYLQLNEQNRSFANRVDSLLRNN